MRNLFDQYEQPENRLSHALAVCLNEDRALLRAFVSRVGGSARDGVRRLAVVEQSLPGDPPETEEDADRRGLPDIVIHDEESWCILVESKIQARLSKGQLERHERTLRRRGFGQVACVALTKAGKVPPAGVKDLSWPELYEWLGKVGRGREWPERLRAYMRIAEVKLARDEYLTEGTLTMFDGFPFSGDYPYTYGEGKRLLKLAMAELAESPLLRKLRINQQSGRGMIKGKGGRGVWNFFSFEGDRGAFTSYPHLTLGVHDEGLNVALTIPNGAKPAVRSRLAGLTVEQLSKMNEQILKNTKQILKNAKRPLDCGGWVEAYATQRRWRSRSGPAIVDADVHFKLETSASEGRNRAKNQPEWCTLFQALLKNKHSNIQFGYQVKLPWGTPDLDSRRAVDLIAEAWYALKPLLDVLRGQSAHP